MRSSARGKKGAEKSRARFRIRRAKNFCCMAGECCVATALYPLALTCLANPATVPVTEAGRYLQPLMAALELGAAAGKGDCGKLRELLDGGGASVVDERTEVMDQTGEKVKVTALLQAVHHGQHAAVELLLERKANPNIPSSNGTTPLMEAAIGGRLPILRTLLDRKAIAIDAVEPDAGLTAFHCACFSGHADCATELARRGCDMTLRTKDGETGKQLAERLKHTAVLAGLRALVVEQLRTRQQSNEASDDRQQKGSPPPLAVTSGSLQSRETAASFASCWTVAVRR
jgi:hypothetical protein